MSRTSFCFDGGSTVVQLSNAARVHNEKFSDLPPEYQKFQVALGRSKCLDIDSVLISMIDAQS